MREFINVVFPTTPEQRACYREVVHENGYFGPIESQRNDPTVIIEGSKFREFHEEMIEKGATHAFSYRESVYQIRDGRFIDTVDTTLYLEASPDNPLEGRIIGRHSDYMGSNAFAIWDQEFVDAKPGVLYRNHRTQNEQIRGQSALTIYEPLPEGERRQVVEKTHDKFDINLLLLQAAESPELLFPEVDQVTITDNFSNMLEAIKYEGIVRQLFSPVELAERARIIVSVPSAKGTRMEYYPHMITQETEWRQRSVDITSAVALAQQDFFGAKLVAVMHNHPDTKGITIASRAPSLDDFKGLISSPNSASATALEATITDAGTWIFTRSSMGTAVNEAEAYENIQREMGLEMLRLSKEDITDLRTFEEKKLMIRLDAVQRIMNEFGLQAFYLQNGDKVARKVRDIKAELIDVLTC